MKKKLRCLKKLLAGNTTQLLLNYYQENTFAKSCYSLMHLICTYWHLFQKVSSQMFSFFWQQYRSCHSVTAGKVTLTILHTHPDKLQPNTASNKKWTKQELKKVKTCTAWRLVHYCQLQKKNPCDSSRGMQNYSRHVEILTHSTISSGALVQKHCQVLTLQMSVLFAHSAIVLRTNIYNKLQLFTHTTFNWNNVVSGLYKLTLIGSKNFCLWPQHHGSHKMKQCVQTFHMIKLLCLGQW